MSLYRLVRPLLFSLDAEVSHDLVSGIMSVAGRSSMLTALISRLSTYQAPNLELSCMGLHFKNPIGLGAGFDKNGKMIDALGALGFGFLEIGTVTPRPQPGNPKPRLFRLPSAEAAINRMGFNNVGAEALVKNVQRSRYSGILGINIGKNKDTPQENAIDDYVSTLETVYDCADYIAINVSSPNTPGLRGLQAKPELERLLAALIAKRDLLAHDKNRNVPLVLKVAPDLNDEELKDVADVAYAHGMSGVIATNTTISRSEVEGLPHAEEAGGLSGRPIFQRSTSVLRILRELLHPSIAVIASGGIFSVEDAITKLEAGANLVQLYTGLIYEGPGLAGRIARGLAEQEIQK